MPAIRMMKKGTQTPGSQAEETGAGVVETAQGMPKALLLEMLGLLGSQAAMASWPGREYQPRRHQISGAQPMGKTRPAA